MSGYNPDGIICTPEDRAIEIASNANHTPTLICLTRDQSIGLTLTAEAGFVSGIAVLVVFALIIVMSFLQRCLGCFSYLPEFQRKKRQYPTENLIKEPMDLFMLQLFAADFVQAFGAIMNVKWIKDGKVQMGDFCTAQGAIKELGEMTVGMTTLIITIYTCYVVWRGRPKHPMRCAYLLVACVFLFIILYIPIEASTHDKGSSSLYGPAASAYWCWIRGTNLGLIIPGEYVWLWLTVVFSVFLYIPLAFKFLFLRTRDPLAEQQMRTALSMLVYPVVYSLLIIHLSVVRFLAFARKPISSANTLTAITIFGLFGLFNVLLFVVTRPKLLLFDKQPALNGALLPPAADEDTKSDPAEQDERLGPGTNLDISRL